MVGGGVPETATAEPGKKQWQNDDPGQKLAGLRPGSPQSRITTAVAAPVGATALADP